MTWKILSFSLVFQQNLTSIAASWNPIRTVTSAAYDNQFSYKTSFGVTTFIHSWRVHFALTEVQLQSISKKIIIICKDYQPSPESNTKNTKNIAIMKKIIILFFNDGPG